MVLKTTEPKESFMSQITGGMRTKETGFAFILVDSREITEKERNGKIHAADVKQGSLLMLSDQQVAPSFDF